MVCYALIAMSYISNSYHPCTHPRDLLKFDFWLYVFPGTRSGESAGGSLVGIVSGGSIFTVMNGSFIWEEVQMFGESPRHSLRLLPGPEAFH